MNRQKRKLVDSIERLISEKKHYNEIDKKVIQLIEDEFSIYGYLKSLLEMKKNNPKESAS